MGRSKLFSRLLKCLSAFHHRPEVRTSHSPSPWKMNKAELTTRWWNWGCQWTEPELRSLLMEQRQTTPVNAQLKGLSGMKLEELVTKCNDLMGLTLPPKPA